MSVFIGGPYVRLTVMLNTLSSLKIESIIIIIIIIIINIIMNEVNGQGFVNHRPQCTGRDQNYHLLSTNVHLSIRSHNYLRLDDLIT